MKKSEEPFEIKFKLFDLKNILKNIKTFFGFDKPKKSKKPKKLKTPEQLEYSQMKISVEAWALAAYYLCTPMTFITLVAGVSVLKLVTIPITGILFIKLFFSRETRLSFNAVHLFYLLYILVGVMDQFFYSSEDSTTIVKDLALAFAVALFATLKIYNKREKELMAYAWFLAGIVAMYLCFTSNSTIYGDRTVIVIFGSYEDPNYFCMYLIFPMILSIAQIVEKGKLRYVAIPYICALVWAMIKTGSRGGLLAIMVGVVAYIILGVKSFKLKMKIFGGIIAVAVVAVFVIFPLMPEGVQARYSLEAVQNDKGSGRFEIWQFLLEYVFADTEYLIKGYGINSTVDIMHAAGFSNGNAHQQWIQVLFDQGLIGLIVYFILIVSCIIRNLKTKPEYACAMIAIIAFSMSLNFYTAKQYLNVIMMCAMTYESDIHLTYKPEFYKKYEIQTS